jgi:hypothetical protein
MDDLEKAMVILTRTVHLTLDGHPNKPVQLNNFGIAFQLRFERLGSMDDLEQAVVIFTRAVDLTPDGHPDKPGQLTNLGTALQLRFKQLGSMDDLEQAVVMKTRTHQEKAAGLDSHASCLDSPGVSRLSGQCVGECGVVWPVWD